MQIFKNSCWDESSGLLDYMFFRNHAFNRTKLSTALCTVASSVGSAGNNSATTGTAYCCQCSWLSVIGSDEIELQQCTSGVVEGYSGIPQWVCGGH